MAVTVRGIKHTWQISDSPIGSGDAGEVYDAVCVEQPDLAGVLKKPARVATGGTIMRQAGQIAQEALALERLDGLPLGKAHPPRLLDQAPEIAQGTANFFIISETAPGEDLASLLTHSRQRGKPFPHRVIITVLDALFDLFSRAHKSGVLWNDVKLDHIYWHNPTGKIAVIDWGNALFLEQDQNRGGSSLPRWEDYTQMLDILGNFLQQTAPELYEDLGWEDFLDQKLDSPNISILARRIAYQQEAVHLKLMEYQSLIRVVLNEAPSLDGMQKIQNYQQVLEKLGAPWESEGLLKYSQSLILASLAAKDRNTAVRTAGLVWKLYDQSLDLPWHLVREFFRKPDILSHHAIHSLVKHTFNANWTKALWDLITMARDLDKPAWWEHLYPILRQKALGSSTPTPYQACQSALDWAIAQGPAHEDLARRLKHLIETWRDQAVTNNESPFDYALLDLIRGNTHLPSRVRSEVKTSFTPGARAIRIVMQAWAEADWETLFGALNKVAAWDPDRWGIISLAEELTSFQDWLTRLLAEPTPNTNIHLYFSDLIDTRPAIENKLGTASWLDRLVVALVSINLGDPIHNHQSLVAKYCPWLLAYPSLETSTTPDSVSDQQLNQMILARFIETLKAWMGVEAALSDVKEKAPEFHPPCSKLAAGFKAVFSLNFDPDLVPVNYDDSIHPGLAEGFQALRMLVKWRGYLAKKDLSGAIHVLDQAPLQDWPICQHARDETILWNDGVAPALHGVMDAVTRQLPTADENISGALLKSLNNYQSLWELWHRIYLDGIHQDLLESLEEIAKQARAEFLAWRHDHEKSTDRVVGLLYHHHGAIIRALSDKFSKLAQHTRQASLNFSVNSQAHPLSPMMLFHVGENTLDHLEAVEELLISEPKDRHFPRWQGDFKKLSAPTSSQSLQQVVLSLPDNHPLSGWLVKSLFHTQ